MNEVKCDPFNCFYRKRDISYYDFFWSDGMDGHYICETCGEVVPNYVNSPKFIHRCDK